MQKRRLFVSCVCALGMVALLAAPVSAQILTAGIDVWTTPDDGSTYVDFTDNPLPAGFFCKGSEAFAQRITLKGSPLATSPANVLRSTDTVIERAEDVNLSGGSDTTPIRVRAISFVNRSPISVPGCSDTFNAKVVLNGTASQGTMTISSGNTFNASFTVPGRILFKNNSTGEWLAASAAETVSLQTSNASWADSVGTGGIVYEDTVSIDTDGDGRPDHSTPGTTPGFAAGWTNRCNPPCPVKIDHNGPHPTWPLPPPPPCAQPIKDAVSRFEANQAEPTATEAGTSGSSSASGEETEESSEITVQSSTQVGGQQVTLIGATDHVTPCIAQTSTSTHVVAEN